MLFNSLPPTKHLNSITIFEDYHNNMNNKIFNIKWLLERVQKKSNAGAEYLSNENIECSLGQFLNPLRNTVLVIIPKHSLPSMK